MSDLRKLASLLAHRGPDGGGFHRHGTVGLVHRRLSILDLEGGAQPIASADERSHIVANGEIYNYRELQNRIRGWGFQLRTDSDSEVPLYAWDRYGMEFVRHLVGMYAVAIYDETTEELVLARDPVGRPDHRAAFRGERSEPVSGSELMARPLHDLRSPDDGLGPKNPG